jgi:type II secretory pathway component PulF
MLKASLARFAWSLSGLLGSGVSLLPALETVEKVVGNVQLEEALIDVRASVSKGEPIAKKLADTKVFPPLVVQMVKIGEESGSLPDMLNRVAEHYDMMVDYGVKRLTTLIEPIALLLIGGAVAFIFASLILPIFRMVSVLRQ